MRYLKLTLFIFLLYAPFMGYRVLRTAGDDKVYVAQALEMARDGHWFVQTMADRPDYYKGPMHFLLVRAGMLLFGQTMWATVWMNLALVIVAAWACCALMAANLPDGAVSRGEKPRAWGAWVGGAFATGIGIYLHAYASQMEVELAAFYALGIYFLRGSQRPGREGVDHELVFWIVAGLTGWIKSPLHSAFLGVTALLYWGATRDLGHRLKSARSWGYAVIGILTCVAGYAPMLIFDRENWINTYLLRETFNKGPSGEPWFSPVWPILSFFLFPWMLLAFVSYADGFSRLFARDSRLGAQGRAMLALGISLVAPSMAFFVWFEYRAQNYTLPAAAGMMLVIATLWSSATRFWRILYQAAIALTGLAFVAWSAGFAVLGQHYTKMPEGWPAWVIPALIVGGLVTGLAWIGRAFVDPDRPFAAQKLVYATLPFFLAFGALYAVLGEREMLDLKRYIAQHPACEGRPLQIGYYNLQRKLWSEWGYLNYQVRYPIQGLHAPEALDEAVRGGKLILVAEKANADSLVEMARAKFPELEAEVMPWHRWRTQGKAEDGSTLWQASWNRGDLTVLEAIYTMIRFHPKGRPVAPGC
jgi:4-amino-4-deoxy-L-arabinose transferase-like glycosyltransferase